MADPLATANACRPLDYGRPRRRRLVPPTLLLLLGVYLLVGCIPIPATGLFQTNGKRTPDVKIGTSADAPVSLGRTRIEDALRVLIEQTIDDSVLRADANATKNALRRWTSWAVSPDGRHFRIGYSVRTGYTVYPLCFFAETNSRVRWVQLDIDERGIVTAGHVVNPSSDARFDTPDPQFWQARGLADRRNAAEDVLSPEMRRRFEEAGLLLSDGEMTQLKQGQRLAATRAATRAERWQAATRRTLSTRPATRTEQP